MTMKRLAAVSLALLGLAGCGSAATTGATNGPAATPSSSPSIVALDEKANHSTVRVGVGATVRIDLHSTYWSPVTSSAPQLVQPAGSSSSPSPSCRPVGGGCGTVTTTFTARAAGTAQLTAERTSCGEAMVCPPDQRSFAVTVVVAG